LKSLISRINPVFCSILPLQKLSVTFCKF
jgi:hypothetical protein